MKLAAVGYEAGNGDHIDVVLRTLAHELRAQGYKLAGAVQWNEPRANQSRDAMILEDLATGNRLDVSGPTGPESDGCRLDSYALESVVGIVAGTIHSDVDLVILNRFGKQEAARAGFRPVIEAAVVHDLPLLTGLNNAYRALWNTFTNGECAYLAPNRESILSWANATLPPR